MPSTWPATLPAPLVSLRAQVAGQSIRTEMETGRIRQRRMTLEGRKLYDVEFNFTEDQFSTFKTFFDVTLENGSLSFMLDVLGTTEAEVAFMAPYSWNRTDNLFGVRGVLEVVEDSIETTLTVDISEAVPGLMFVNEENYELLVVVTNGSEGVSLNVVLVVTLPASFTFVSSTPACTVNGSLLTFEIGDMEADAVENFSIIFLPTVEGTFTSEADITTDTTTLVGSVLHDEVDHETFDRAPCELLGITNGGGQSFECYDEGVYTTATLILAGEGITAQFLGPSPFGEVEGDDFELYAEGSYSGGSPSATAAGGFSQIYVGDGP